MLKTKYVFLFMIFAASNSVFAAKIINAGIDFKTALNNWNKISTEQQQQQWEDFESKYPYIFDYVIYQKQNSGWEIRKEKKRDKFFKDLPSIQSNMEQLINSANDIVAEKEKKFKKLFPDLADNIPVFLIPSMFSFNGKVVNLPDYNRTGLLMGVDFIVYRNDNLDVLFSHEFFHAYHEDKLPPGSTGKTMATPLWKEGFATFISGRLNEFQPDSVLLMDEDLALSCEKPEYVAELAKLFLDVIDSDGEQSYSDWFMMSGTTLPLRRGYCLGLQVVREISKNNDLKEMTTWTEVRFSQEIKNTLNSFINLERTKK